MDVNCPKRTVAICRIVAIAIIWSALSGLSTPAKIGDVTIVVSRLEHAVEIYIGMSAETAVSAFDLSPEHLTERDGSVDFDELRNGTWDIGDHLWKPVKTRLGGKDMHFESMSLMVHPIEDKLPLETPIDGMTTIAICSVAPPQRAMGLPDLWLYSGYITYTDKGRQPLTIKLPQTGRGPISLTLLDFDHWQEGKATKALLEDGATIVANYQLRGLSEQIRNGELSHNSKILLSALAVALLFTILLLARHFHRRQGCARNTIG